MYFPGDSGWDKLWMGLEVGVLSHLPLCNRFHVQGWETPCRCSVTEVGAGSYMDSSPCQWKRVQCLERKNPAFGAGTWMRPLHCVVRVALVGCHCLLGASFWGCCACVVLGNTLPDKKVSLLAFLRHCMMAENTGVCQTVHFLFYLLPSLRAKLHDVPSSLSLSYRSLGSHMLEIAGLQVVPESPSRRLLAEYLISNWNGNEVTLNVLLLNNEAVLSRDGREPTWTVMLGKQCNRLWRKPLNVYSSCPNISSLHICPEELF